MIGRAFGSIYQPLIVYIISFLPKNNTQILCKISDFRHPVSIGNGMMFCKEMHPLLLECFITFLRCVRMTGRAFDDICMTLMVHITSFLLKITLKFHAK